MANIPLTVSELNTVRFAYVDKAYVLAEILSGRVIRKMKNYTYILRVTGTKPINY